MRLLAPQILASPLVDRYDIWVNTTQSADLAFFDRLAALDPRVRLVAQPEGRVRGSHSIGEFHRFAVDEDAIYVRFDDDVVWLQPDFFEKHLAFRAANPDFLLTAPLVINNAVCTALLVETGKIDVSRRVSFAALDKVGWKDGRFAESLHAMFLDLVEAGQWSKLHGGACPIALNRFSINCISWFGRDLAPYPDLIGIAEEYDWTVTSSWRTGRANCLATDAVVAHYAFYSQRHWMDRSDLLDRYERWLLSQPRLAPLLRRLAEAVDETERNGKASGRDGGIMAIAPSLRETIGHALRRVRGRQAKVRLADDRPG
jgi:hypothetical protein